MSDLAYEIGASTARYPLVRILVNGAAVDGTISAEITVPNFYHSSTFTIEAAASASATTWWDGDPPLLIEIDVAEDGITFQPVFTGEVDTVDWSWDTGLVTLTGRDLSARFIEAKTQAAYQNQTSSEIAQDLAASHAMTADVDPTTTLVQRYYQIDHNLTADDEFSRVSTEWDLLTYLAQYEGFDLWVSGTTLHFKKPTDTSSPTYTVKVQSGDYRSANVENLRLNRSYTLAKDIQVDVRSWNSRHEKGFTKSVRAVGAKSAAAQASSNQVGTGTQRYTYTVPNLTEDQALKYGLAQLAKLTYHERTITFDAPATAALNQRSIIAVEGTGSSWDQSYRIDSITFSLNLGVGWNMNVTAKNSSTRSQVVTL